MERANAIEELTFDFWFASQSTASAQHEAVAEKAQYLGTTIIDEVLEEFEVPDTILVDRLDLDLGFVAVDSDEFADRLREQLRSLLRDVLASNSVPLDHGGNQERPDFPIRISKREDRQADFDVVWHLLVTGQLPWRYTTADPGMIDNLVDRVLASDGAEIAARIGAAPDRPGILTRIARQWTPAQRARLASYDVYGGLVLDPLEPARMPQGEADGFLKSNSLVEAIADAPQDLSVGHVLDEHGPLLAALFKALNLAADAAELAAARGAVKRMIQLQPGLLAALEKLESRVLQILEFKAGNNKPGSPADVSGAQTFGEAYELALGLIEAVQRRNAVDRTEFWRSEWLSGKPGLAAIEELHKLDANVARAFVRELASDPAWIASASGHADRDFWHAILAAWGSEADDSDLILAAVLTLAFLATDGDPPSSAAAMRAELLAIVLLGDGAAFQTSFVLSRLVTVAAERRGRRVARLARSLLDTAPAAMRIRLAEQLASVTSLLVSETTPVSLRASGRGSEQRLEKSLAAARWPVESWQNSETIAPNRLAERLLIFAASARWRDAFAAELNPDRVRLLLGLWLPEPAIEPLARLFGEPQDWQVSGAQAPSQRQIYASLLAALRRSVGAVSDPVQLVESAVLAIAQDRNIDPLVLARAILRALAQDSAASWYYLELSHRWHDADNVFAHEIETGATMGPMSVASLSWSLSEGRTEAASVAGSSDKVRLPRTNVLAPGVAEPKSIAGMSDNVRRQRDDVLASNAVEPKAIKELTDEGRRQVYEALAPGRAALVFGLFDRLGAAWAALGHGSFSLASDDAVLRRALFDKDAALDRTALASAWAAPRLATLGSRARGRAAQVLARLVGSSAPLSDREPPRVAPIESTEADHVPAGPFQPSWYAALPSTIPVDLRRQLTQMLAPAREGLLRLRGLDEASQRQLLIRVEPEFAPSLMMVDALDGYWRDAGLPDGNYDQAGRSVWLALRVLFEQRLGFDPFVLTSEWLAARRHALPVEIEHARLWDLVQPGTMPAPRALDILKKTALPRALRLAGVARPEVPASPANPIWPGISARDEPAMAEPVRVENAGLVLLGPYFVTLFEHLDLARAGEFVNAEAAERAVHVLELLVDGIGQTLEPGLALNKLICGFDLLQPIGRDFIASVEEQDLANSLLETVIERWGKLGSTSVEGLREAFLQRTGRIAREEGGWRLTVESSSIDVLVDGLPWGFRTLKLPWMQGVLHVEWR